jgi:hypothetical protein
MAIGNRLNHEPNRPIGSVGHNGTQREVVKGYRIVRC